MQAQPVNEILTTLDQAFSQELTEYGKEIKEEARMPDTQMDALEKAIKESFSHSPNALAAINAVLGAEAKDGAYNEAMKAAFAKFEEQPDIVVDTDFKVPPYEPKDDATFRQFKLATAAKLTSGIHNYYKENPNALTSEEAKAFYVETATPPTPTPMPETAAATIKQADVDKALKRSASAQTLGSLGILLGLAGLGIGLFAFLRGRKKEDPVPTVKKANPSVVNKKEIEALKSTIESLQERISTLESEIDKLEAEQISYKAVPPPKVRVVEKEDAKPEPEVNTLPQLYTTNPRNNVFFSRYMKDNMRPKEHIIRIDIISEKEAEYTLVSHPESIKKAFSVPNTYLQPSFDTKGRPTVQRHRVMQKGKLKKDGENWRIVEKGIISD
jgi:uncharacterized small protein (DUF1192 family)